MFCSLAGDSHLSTLSCPAFASFRSGRLPYQIWVSRLRGLPVPSHRFPGALVSVALLKRSFHGRALGRSAAVRREPARIYVFIRHKHYSRRRLCEHGLSSNASRHQRLSDTQCYFLNTSSSRRERRFRISTCDCGGIVSPSAPAFASSSAIFAFSCSTWFS